MKKRLIGAVVLIALAAIVLPFILKNQGANRSDIANLKLPAEPIYQVPKNMMAGIDKSIEKTGTTIATTSKEITDIDTSKISQGNADTAEAVPGSIGTTRPQTQAAGSLGFRLPTQEEREEAKATSPAPKPAPAPEPVKVASTPKAAEPAPAPKPKPQPAPQTTSTILGGAEIDPGYAVQIFATPYLSKAQNLKREMIKDEYNAFIMKIDKNGTPYYRLRIGTYPQKANAEDLLATLKRRYTINKDIQNSGVVYHK